MRLDDIWYPKGDTLTPDDAGIEVYEEYPGRFWIALTARVMRGPFDARSVLRALRIACTPVVEGCELGPAQRGFDELPGARDFDPRLKQSWRDPRTLPESATRYPASIAPAVVATEAGEFLAKSWNLHPRGSRVCRDAEGVTIVETA